MKNKKTPMQTGQKHVGGFLVGICIAMLYGICLFGLCTHSTPTQEWDNNIDKNAIPAKSPRVPEPKIIHETSKPKKFRHKCGGWYTKMPWE